jgi:hypothetical protein
MMSKSELYMFEQIENLKSAYCHAHQKSSFQHLFRHTKDLAEHAMVFNISRNCRATKLKASRNNFNLVSLYETKYYHMKDKLSN